MPSIEAVLVRNQTRWVNRKSLSSRCRPADVHHVAGIVRCPAAARGRRRSAPWLRPKTPISPVPLISLVKCMQRRLQARPGLVDCLSVFGSNTTVDVNTAQPAVLAAIGLTPDAINLIVQRRNLQALRCRGDRRRHWRDGNPHRSSSRGGPFHRYHPRHRALAASERATLGFEAHRGRHGQVHAAGLRFAHSHSALV